MTDAEKLADAILWSVGVRIEELTPYGRAAAILAAQAGLGEAYERAANACDERKVACETAHQMAIDQGDSVAVRTGTVSRVQEAEKCAEAIRAMKEQAND